MAILSKKIESNNKKVEKLSEFNILSYSQINEKEHVIDVY